MLSTQSKFHCKHEHQTPPTKKTVLHKADQIKLFAVGQFCCHFVWKCYNISILKDWYIALLEEVTLIRVIFFLVIYVWYAVNILRWGSKPEWVFTPENSQGNLHLSNPLIASWQNVYTILSNSILPVNGKAGRDIMFCIKPLKPMLHNVVCRSYFDHTDIFTSEVIPNLFFGARSEDQTLWEGWPCKTAVTIMLCFQAAIFVRVCRSA